MVIGLELMIVQKSYTWALLCCIIGVAIALFPSNYEIVGMEEDQNSDSSDANSDISLPIAKIHISATNESSQPLRIILYASSEDK